MIKLFKSPVVPRSRSVRVARRGALHRGGRRRVLLRGGRNRKKGERLMTLSRGQLIPVVLVALAILLPGAAEAQGNCCSCSYDGTNCSACCYIEQTASCHVDISGSV